MAGKAQVSKSFLDVVDEVAIYPPEAFEFVQQGLHYIVNKLHGPCKDKTANRHVSGQQLCQGLLEYGQMQWGLLAGLVLRRWNIRSTLDFGRIVFAMAENGF